MTGAGFFLSHEDLPQGDFQVPIRLFLPLPITPALYRILKEEGIHLKAHKYGDITHGNKCSFVCISSFKKRIYRHHISRSSELRLFHRPVLFLL
ncbi:hypothetical protein SK128_019567, partial [Halocaridina rubra]